MELNVSDLSVSRGGIAVLEGLSFSILEGEALVLRGPNGSGKTTLLRTIAGLQPPLRGTIGLEREAMAYAGHSDGIKSVLTVRENLQFWADVFETGAIDPALQAFDLSALENRPAGGLSAGQKRRLGLARMVVSGRPVWVLDEPTVSLDLASVAMFAEAVRAHLAAGGLALLATHIDLGLSEARMLDVTPFKAIPPEIDDFDGDFL
ncbi:Cytochrome c biogenesis ATP-binding export protein CcmA [Thalassovita gelatinovora]|uniref:Cytochrome c biogenesis ATP-binding export protein CcmA n=1 Tax=Thalassovita gelatinovora TaxID=53501 RepID=A0A0P1F444_THAGE|nr:heme ABC exporter ATP-binding protein CcmA [Thalassovita gelatinovora]QIZ79236.1 heme ABC exporter ATP-binding protein CcmA [Thalassovita gelatinovora]CUH62406.1 Cytochrome c biogenesis ATP-binding export protein CcmA [Thalassovita gelatinovora]SER18146.1 heme exporter protein A [Thalassovita gelatinovora]